MKKPGINEIQTVARQLVDSLPSDANWDDVVYRMEGPLLDALLHRLANCPPEFLEPPRSAASRPFPPRSIDVVAIVCDHMRRMAPARAPEQETATLRELRGMAIEPQRLVAVMCWLLHDPWFLSRPALGPAMWKLLVAPEIMSLAKLVTLEKFVSDPDRREELVRVCLKLLGLRPQGETEIQAADRLTTLDSSERRRILRATAAAERRAREIREAMARQAAQDAASRYGE